MQASQLRPKASIGPYRIARLLAKGGMGQLYLAERDRQQVVLKLLREAVAEDSEFRAMFLHEARIGALLDHPSIARIVDSGELDGAPYLAVEYVDGPPLSGLMSRLGGIGKAEAIAIVVHIAEALAYAHEATDEAGRPLHIVHRDVTPQNVLVQRDGRVKLIDFGVARSTTQEHRTSTGVLKGKLAYMAPEQFRGETSNRSDIWSLGVVLWELLTGRRLFKRKTEAVVFSAVLIDPIPPLALGGELDEVLQPIVDRALERDPQRRYASAARLARDLRSGARELALGCGPAELAALVARSDERALPDEQTELVLSQWTETSVEVDLTDASRTAAATPASIKQRHMAIARPVAPPVTRHLRRPRPYRRALVAALAAAASAGLVGLGAWWADRDAPIASEHVDAAPEITNTVPVSARAPERPQPVEAARPEPPEPQERATPPEPAAPSPPSKEHRERRTTTRAARAPVGTGQLYLSTDPWTTVRVGGRVLGQTPIVGAELPAGRHVLQLTDPNGRSHRYPVRIRPNAATKRVVRLP